VTDGRGETTLAELARPLRPIPETSSVAQLLERFVEKQEHMFLVVDEYGGTAGIVTLEDAIESLLGAEITDESDLVTDLRALAQERARRRGRWVAPRGRPEE
jgi:CBS domain containing-hemolysin-like protein